MGPTVWELEGPMPILKSSKRLVFTELIVGVGVKAWLALPIRSISFAPASSEDYGTPCSKLL
jgi:hypothetical protein